MEECLAFNPSRHGLDATTKRQLNLPCVSAILSIPVIMLNVKTVRERLHQSPFTPFYIHLTDGRRVLVEHPDFVSVGGSVVVVSD